jgi:hypothetical protein
MKSNVLPFPVQHMPKDPPRFSLWRAIRTLVVYIGLLALLIWLLWH